MLRAYRAQDWDHADAALAAGLPDYKGYGLGALHALFAKRIATLRDQSPGAAWDGVFQASEK
jgi:adenylate cyclase